MFRIAHLLHIVRCSSASFLLLFFGASVRAEITVETNFPGGSGTIAVLDQEEAIIQIDPTNYPGRGWRCWWYVRLNGLLPDRDYVLDVGESPWATPDQATFSVDKGRTWRHTAPGSRDGKRIRYRLQFDTPTALVAWGPPFVPTDAANLVARLARTSPDAVRFILCRTRENRNIPGIRVSAAINTVAQPNRPLIWVQARQHAWESGSSWVAKGFAEWVVSDAVPAVRLRENYEIVVIPIMDVDNVYRGAGGKAQKPQDHNRDWSDQPHWRAVATAQKELRKAADAGRLAAFIDLHNPGANDRSPYFYVPAEDLLSAAAQTNLQVFLAAAETEISGPLRFRGKVIASGRKYDPKAWTAISKNWVAKLGTPAVAVTLETAWNTPHSTIDGYETVGRQLAMALSRYVESR